MPVVEIVDGIIDLIRKNMIAQTPLTLDGVSGSTIIAVENSFQFADGQEIIFIDNGYNVPDDPHYQIFEYSRIKQVIDTTTVELFDELEGDWLISRGSFIQKTIGSSPLYTDRVYYGDRDVIPSEEMSITVEPLSMSNEWIYIQGGLSEEYRVSITVYGKDVNTEGGMRVLNKYVDALYLLFMSNIHIDINNYESPLLYDVNEGDTTVYVSDTIENREYFKLSSELTGDCDPFVGTPPTIALYDVQDNKYTDIDMQVVDIQPAEHVDGGEMAITFNRPLLTRCQCDPTPDKQYLVSEYAVLRKQGRYIYDSRVDNLEYGLIQKGSAFIRAARLNWFGKEVEEFRFPQRLRGVDYNPSIG